MPNVAVIHEPAILGGQPTGSASLGPRARRRKCPKPRKPVGSRLIRPLERNALPMTTNDTFVQGVVTEWMARQSASALRDVILGDDG